MAPWLAPLLKDVPLALAPAEVGLRVPALALFALTTHGGGGSLPQSDAIAQRQNPQRGFIDPFVEENFVAWGLSNRLPRR